MSLLCLYASGREWCFASRASDASAQPALGINVDDDPGSIGPRLRAHCDEHGIRSDAVVVGLPTSWCLWGVVPLGIPGGHRARVYRLEEQLPLSAEDFVAGFVRGPVQEFGCAVRRDRLEGLAQSLRDAGWGRVLALPTSLAIAQALSTDHASGVDAVVVASDLGADVVVVEGEAPKAWWAVAQGPEGVRERLRALETELGRAPLTHDTIDASPKISGLLTNFAAAALAGHPEPWLDLSSQGLSSVTSIGRRSLVALGAAAMFLPAAVIASNVAAAARDEAQARHSTERQAEYFKSVVPGQAVPASVSARLRSIAQELRSHETTGPAAAPSALTMLYAALARFPEQRLRIVEIRAGEGSIGIDGQATSHGDAEALAVALRDSDTGPKLVVASPKSNTVADGGVAFSLSGSVQGLAESKGGGR